MRLAGNRMIALLGLLAGVALLTVPSARCMAAGSLLEPESRGSQASMRLLSQSQYTNTIVAIFGDHIAPNVRFAPVPRIGGLMAVGARQAVMTLGALEPLESAARAVAGYVVSEANRHLLIPCRPAAADSRDDVCARAFLAAVGRLLLRRALTAAELDDAAEFAGAATEQAGDFHDGLAAALSYLLVSPKFLYIQEIAEADPANPGQWRLDSYSKASRLSFFLLNAAPDSALLDAAESGRLHTPEGMRTELARMLASPRIEQGVRAFFDDMLVAEGFDLLAKDPIIYPAFTSKVVLQAREQLLRTIVDHLIDRHGDYRDLFVTRRTFMTRDLAAVYRVPVNAGPNQWVPYEFSEDGPRAGLLTQVGFLARYSHPGRTSPTNRGRGLRETLLCQHVPDPPPNVSFELFENATAKRRTARQRLDAHNTNPICAGCHRLTDPLGLILEHFDGAGQYRLTENGAPIDPSGEVNRVPVTDAIDLGHRLREDPALTSCLVSRTYSYATGQQVEPADRPLLRYLETRFDQDGYRFPELLHTIATSRAFYRVKAPDALIAMENTYAH